MNAPAQRAPDAPPHILCLGGGYTAIYLCRVMRRAMRRGEVRVTVIDHDNFQCFHGLVPEMLTGKIQPTDVLSPARRLFAPATFVNAEIEKVDLEAGSVTVGRLLDGRRQELAYDHLVLALGTTDNLGRFPGLAEHAFRLRTYSGCLAVRNHLISMLELADTERVPTRSIISCAGMATNPLLEALDLPKNERGRLRADRHARVEGHAALWTGGDCGGVPLEGGGEAPALAIWAMTVGALIGKNILRSIRGRELLPYRFTGLGDACVLGKHKAVAHLKGFQMRGFLAWVVWRVFMIYYLPSPEKRVRVVWGWLMASIFGRDIINLRVHQPLDLAPLLYEPGQDIVREGDVGTSLFIIQDGEVEVYRGGPDGPVLATLVKGQHFGEIAVFERCERTASVRAKTRVKLLQVRREAAVALAESLPVAGETLRARPGVPVPS